MYRRLGQSQMKIQSDIWRYLALPALLRVHGRRTTADACLAIPLFCTVQSPAPAHFALVTAIDKESMANAHTV